MEITALSHPNPLGLNIDFLFGRGYLWARQERLSDWITLESLRMEIPDLQFPFDARGGLARFRNTRCLVREIEVAISEAGLQDMLRRAASHLEGFRDLTVRFLEGALHVSLKLRAFGVDTFLSFKVALIPPEPARADEVHLSLYDYRAFGPLPYPARLMAYELVTSLLETPTLRPPGRGKAFTVGLAGDILSLRPLKLLLLHLFPRVGWKLPNLAGVMLDGAQVRPGQLVLRASGRDDSWYALQQEGYQLAATREGARALAAYEAKDLFAAADQALFDGELESALGMLATFREVYGPHPELAARALDCLLADPNATHLAEAASLLRELERDDPEALIVRQVAPVLAQLQRQPTARVIEAYDALAQALRQRNELDDWVLCELTSSQLESDIAPDQAAARLRELLKLAPRNQQALERLLALLDASGDWDGVEEILKRLTGVYTDREALKATSLRLAHHLLERRGQVAEARLYLERVLRLDPTQLEALDTLGHSYTLSDEPLRAVKAYGAAARAAQAASDTRRAAALHARVASIWEVSLENTAEALLSCRRALHLLGPPSQTVDLEGWRERLSVMRHAAALCEARERWDEALAQWTDAAALAERVVEHTAKPPERRHAERGALAGLDALDTPHEQAPPDEDLEALRQIHERLAQLYTRRDRPDAAAPHWRRVLALAPEAVEAAEQLEQHYRASGRPEALIQFYRDRQAQVTHDDARVTLALKLATVYEALHMIEDAQTQLQEALRLSPTHDGARARLVELLRTHGRYETLRDALAALLLRVRDRQTRRELLMTQAELLLTRLDQPRQAARAYFEALDLRPADRDALMGARRALDTIVSREGASAPAPVGPGEASRLLERVLLKLAEVSPDVAEQRDLLGHVAALASGRGDEDAAREAKRRAQRLGDAPSSARVDDRLDALLAKAPEAPSPEPPILEAAPSAEQRARFGARYLKPLPSEADADSSAVTVTMEAVKPQAELGAFRAQMQEVWRQPGSIKAPEAESSLSKLMGDRTGARPKLKLPKLREDEDDARTRELSVPILDAALTEAIDEAWDTLAALAKIDSARQANSPEELVLAISEALAYAREDMGALSRQQILALSREIGEVMYYELEDARGARAYLERVRGEDPEGLGAESSLLNALEAIYEEEGEVEQRLTLLRGRQARASSKDMQMTFRLLIAQLLWDERRDRAAAEAELEGILAEDPRQEAAHRLMAQIAREVGDHARAAHHYEQVLRDRVGGLDEVELERDLADLYLHQLDQPERAMRHYEGVLKAAPADAHALEGIKQCQAARKDWTGYLDSLGRELGLLMGQQQGVALRQPGRWDAQQVSMPLRTAASQIVSDAAKIAQEQLRDLPLARALWGQAYQLWPDQVEALERRLTLDRQLDAHEDLAHDLEAYAEFLLDAQARFEALVEAAEVTEQRLQDPERARQLLAEAIASAQDAAEPIQGLDQVRRKLQQLQQA